MKDKLLEAFGTVGALLIFIAIPLFSVLPFVMLGLPWWAVLLILFVLLLLTLVPIAGSIVRLVAWVWSFVLVIGMEVNFWVVLYYIGLGCYLIFLLFPTVLGLITHLLSLFHARQPDEPQ